MKYFNILIPSFIALIGFSCASPEGIQKPLDEQATKETTMLYRNMKQLAEHGIMFGHHEASSRQGEFHPKPLTEPYVIVSHHTALVIQI
jgi:hypothetical protein